MEKHKCKLCIKSFTNGKALGGHMRSHMLYHPPPPSPQYSSSSENELEWSKTATRRRSKRVQRLEQHFQNYSSSSISNVSTEEDVAFCLMMLSRDKWNESIDIDIESKKSSRMEYRCETCDKVFRSYQALGGHKASHKKMKLNNEKHYHKTKIVFFEDRIHECDICFKVFSSGQALGGHKRTHGNVGKHRINFNVIDLNLPAPFDDEDVYDDDASQFEASVVSDGEFIKSC